MEKLIFGCGYLGLRVARAWRAAGDDVFCVTRKPERAESLREEGLRPIVADITRPKSLAGLPAAETVLFAVGHDRTAGLPIREVYVDGLRNVLRALPLGTGRLIYVSSTGVYGQTDGLWVDEDSPCEPTREGGIACLEAERLLASDAIGERTAVLRLGGIYGPGRIPQANLLRRGLPIAAPPNGFLNLIHVEDAVRVVLAVERRAPLPRCYNVCDGRPALRADYYLELARLLNAPPPVFAPPPADAPVAERAGSDKRVSNARLVRELNPALRFPSYRDGLAAILSSDTPGD